MKRDEGLIEQINRLWLPVYPFMADHVLSASAIRSGRILDLGPFAGGIAVSILEKSPEFHATVLDESMQVLQLAAEWARQNGCASRLTLRQAAFEIIDEPDGSFDVVVIRGAFFFLTPALLHEVRRVLCRGGFAWAGGGYGPLTPPEVIAPIADYSRKLNEKLGKKRITLAECQNLFRTACLAGDTRVSDAGGLWIEMRG